MRIAYRRVEYYYRAICAADYYVLYSLKLNLRRYLFKKKVSNILKLVGTLVNKGKSMGR